MLPSEAPSTPEVRPNSPPCPRPKRADHGPVPFFADGGDAGAGRAAERRDSADAGNGPAAVRVRRRLHRANLPRSAFEAKRGKGREGIGAEGASARARRPRREGKGASAKARGQRREGNGARAKARRARAIGQGREGRRRERDTPRTHGPRSIPASVFSFPASVFSFPVLFPGLRLLFPFSVFSFPAFALSFRLLLFRLLFPRIRLVLRSSPFSVFSFPRPVSTRPALPV